MIYLLSLVPIFILLLANSKTTPHRRKIKHWQDSDDKREDLLLHTIRQLTNEERLFRWQVKMRLHGPNKHMR
jgi:hypothetical protein